MQVDWRLCLGAVVLLAILAIALYYSTAKIERKLNQICAALKLDEHEPPKPKKASPSPSFDV